MKSTISIEINTDTLPHYTDEYVAQLWHVAQANPKPYGDREAGQLAEHVGREIIRRWLSDQQPALWAHQGTDHWRKVLMDNGPQSAGQPIQQEVIDHA